MLMVTIDFHCFQKFPPPLFTHTKRMVQFNRCICFFCWNREILFLYENVKKAFNEVMNETKHHNRCEIHWRREKKTNKQSTNFLSMSYLVNTHRYRCNRLPLYRYGSVSGTFQLNGGELFIDHPTVFKCVYLLHEIWFLILCTFHHSSTLRFFFALVSIKHGNFEVPP